MDSPSPKTGDTIRETIFDLYIKKHLWRPPKLHRDASVPPPLPSLQQSSLGFEVETRYQAHRSETWYELFYDLVFVAAALQIGHIAQANITFEGIFKSGLLFAIMRATWDQLTFYQNRFDTKDMLHYSFYLLQAMCAFVMAEHLTLDESHEKWDKENNLRPFIIAACVARLSNAGMYFQVITMTSAYRRHFIAVAMSQIIATLIYLSTLVFSHAYNYYYGYWLFALFTERTFVMAYIYFFVPRDASSTVAPWHMGHLIEREGTFILLILGEAIIQLVQHPGGETTKDYLRGLMGFAIVFNIGDIYYQQQLLEKEVIRDYTKRSPSYIWISLHLLLSLTILFFAAGIKLVYDEEAEHNSNREQWLMCLCAGTSIFVIFSLRMNYKGKTSLFRGLSYLFRYTISILCMLVPLFTSHATSTVGILFFLTTLLVIQDLFSYKVPVRSNSTDSSSIANFKLFGSLPPKIRQEPITNLLHSGHERRPNDLGSEADSLLHSLVSHDEHRIGAGPPRAIY